MSTSEGPKTLTKEQIREVLQSEIQQNLDPCSVSEAVEIYFDERREGMRESSLGQHRSALRFFQQWCTEKGINDLNNLTGRQLKEYKNWRKEEAPTKTDSLAKSTLSSQMAVIRQFIQLCETINAVGPDLHQSVPQIRLEEQDEVRDEILNPERASRICSFLSKHEYATREHVVWKLGTKRGPRAGGLRALDRQDFIPDGDPPRIVFRHRPDTGTPLKNGKSGERQVSLTPGMRDVLNDYIDINRVNVMDEHGRQPLLTTSQGRLSLSTIRKYFYKWTRPCLIGRECPHDRDPSECEAAESGSESKCPSSKSSHTVRKGYITHQLNNNVHLTYLSGRCDATEDVLKKHYDGRSEEEKMRVRQRAFEHARLEYEAYGGDE